MYVSTADFRAPFDPVDFQGLGDVSQRWPAGRSYWTTANFRAPYDEGYFQNNTLFGVPSDYDPASNGPKLVRRYVVNGEPVPTTLRDAVVPFNQVNRWVYVGVGLLSLVGAYRSYKKWKKEKKGNGSSAAATTSG
jgi:hypothetical protein